MKETYPNYKRGELDLIYSKLTKSEQTTIKDFLAYCDINAVSKRKLEDMQRSIVQFRHITEKPFDKLDLDILRKYLTLLNKSNRQKYTINGIKTHLKRFLRWKFADWFIKFDDFKDIKTVNGFNEEKINESVLLKKEQIEKIIRKEKDLAKKTFFICLYESGLRPKELRTLKWKDINFNVEGDLTEFYIYATKTGKARTVYVKESTFYLNKLREHKSGDFVFVSREGKNKPIGDVTATLWIKQMGKRINVNIYPYILRHSRATELYLNMPSKVAQKFMGHGKDMSDFYCHLSSKDIKDSMLKTVYSFEELPEQKKHELELRITELENAMTEISKHHKQLERNNKVLINLTEKSKNLLLKDILKELETKGRRTTPRPN